MVVITHPEHGIFVGTALGLGFWSLLDSAGQDSVSTFQSVQDAKRFVASWSSDNDCNTYSYPDVVCRNKFYATVEELCRAGLAQLLGDLGTPVDGCSEGLNS